MASVRCMLSKFTIIIVSAKVIIHVILFSFFLQGKFHLSRFLLFILLVIVVLYVTMLFKLTMYYLGCCSVLVIILFFLVMASIR